MQSFEIGFSRQYLPHLEKFLGRFMHEGSIREDNFLQLQQMDLSSCSSFKARLLRPSGNPFNNRLQYGLGAVQIGHKCVLVGGYSERTPKVYVYDLNRNRWLSFLPQNHEVAMGRVKVIFTIGDTLYAYLWREGQMRKYVLITYDLIEFSDWHEIDTKDPPTLPYGVSGCFVERRGEAVVTSPQKTAISGAVVVYRVRDKSWFHPKTTGEPPLLDMNHATCSAGTSVFAIGDSKEAPHLCLFHLDVTALPFVWSRPVGGNYFPRSRYLFQASCTVKRIFVYGGYAGNRAFDVYSIQEKRWLTNIRMDNEWRDGTSENAVVQSEERLIVFGGFQLPAQTPLEITPY